MSLPRLDDTPAPRRGGRRLVAAPPPSAEHALAVLARGVLAAARTPPGGAPLPSTWRLPGFGREVERVRRQLVPLRDRPMLVASNERESERLAVLRRRAADPTAPPPPPSAMDVAYAVRWLELGKEMPVFPSWAGPGAGAGA